MKTLLRTLFFLLLTLTGLALLIATVTMRIPSFGFLGKARKTTGTVVQVSHWMESGESYSSPIVEFTTYDGRQISVDMICPPLDCYTDYEIGSKVGVIYPSNFPDMAIADTLMGRLGTPLFISVFGLVLLAIGLVGLAVAIDDILTSPILSKIRKNI